MVREGGDGRGGVGADARQRQELVHVGGDPAAGTPGDGGGAALEAQGARGVAEVVPGEEEMRWKVAVRSG